MKKAVLASVLLFALPTLAAPGVIVESHLSPAGGFVTKSAVVKGVAQMKGDQVSAQNVVVPIDSLNSTIELRDKHMKDKYMEVAKYPNAELIEATGSGGKGRAKIKIHGVTQEVSGTYKIIGGKELEAKFPIKLADFKIEKIRYMGIGVKDDTELTVTLPIQASR